MPPSRTILTGVIVMVSSLLLILSPFFLGGANVISKTLVAFGLIFFLAGASFVLHGTWDWLAARRTPSPRRGEGGEEG